MDGTKFDQLIRQLGTTRVTRLTALRGLAVGAVAATLGFAAPDDVDAKKRCSECQKKKKKKTKSGKTRIRCRAKANGTPCSIGTCQNSVCTRAVSPPPPPPGPTPPPGFNCNVSGCVGGNAGLVCNTSTGACVNCTDFSQCGGQICISGFCLGGEACNTSGDCVAPLTCINPPGEQGLTCLLDAECGFPAPGNSTCPDQGNVDLFCILGECVTTCGTGGQVPANGCTAALGGTVCRFGICTV
jgi:hypothetical protein